MVYNDMYKRCESLARYIIENNTTVRDAAKKFGISKSTVHKDITEKLSKENRGLFLDVKKILQQISPNVTYVVARPQNKNI